LDLPEPALIDIMGHQIILTLPGTLSIKIIVYFGLKTETGKIG
jgi:hypothetical protein